jgi:hypothetical protein
MTARKRKPGRKALPVSEKRGCKVTVYLTRSELAALRAEGQPGTVLRETWIAKRDHDSIFAVGRCPVGGCGVHHRSGPRACVSIDDDVRNEALGERGGRG